jgi:hypothetical protein
MTQIVNPTNRLTSSVFQLRHSAYYWVALYLRHQTRIVNPNNKVTSLALYRRTIEQPLLITHLNSSADELWPLATSIFWQSSFSSKLSSFFIPSVILIFLSILYYFGFSSLFCTIWAVYFFFIVLFFCSTVLDICC